MTVFLIAVIIVTVAAAAMLGAAIAHRVTRAVPIFATAVAVGLALIIAVTARVTS